MDERLRFVGRLLDGEASFPPPALPGFNSRMTLSDSRQCRRRRRPRCKGNLTYLRSVRVQPCIRPVFSRGGSPRRDAAAMAAGPDVIR
jgi:hypothetical protein